MGRVKQTAQRHDLAVANDTHETGANFENNPVDTQMIDRFEDGSDIDAEHELDLEMEVDDEESDVEDDDIDVDEACSDADSFEYNDDNVDEDFELDADGESDYEDGPARRRRNTTTSTPKKASKGSKSSNLPKSNLQTPSKAKATPNKAKATPVKAREISEQQSRALKKAHRDLERKRSKGQPRAKGDRALRCLPYITKNRAPKRELIRWNDETYSHTLLALVWVLEAKGVDVPWEETAAIVHPGATGEAFKQAISKLRVKRLKEDLPVPPTRPGKEKTRKDCEIELERILADSRDVRDAKNVGMSPASAQKEAVVDNDSEEMKMPTFFEYDRMFIDSNPSLKELALPVVESEPEYRSPEKIARWVDNVPTDYLSTVNLQFVTGKNKDVRPRPSSAVTHLQANTDGLPIDLDGPGVGSVNSVLTVRPTPTRPKPGHGRPRSLLEQIQEHEQQQAPSTSSSQTTGSFIQMLPSLAPVTPPPRLRTPEECPPAPRSRSNSDLRGRPFSHLRKRSGEDVGLPPSTPTSKRRQSDAARKSISRKPSLGQIPEAGPADPTPTQQAANVPSQAFDASQGQPLVAMPGGGIIPFPLALQMAYGAYNDSQMGNAPMQLMPPPFMPNMMNPYAYMGNMQQGSVHNNPFLMVGPQAPGQQQMPSQQMPAPWQNASQANTQYTEVKRQRSASQSNDHRANAGIAMQNLSAHNFTSRVSPPASPERDAGPGSVSSGLHESVFNLTTGGDFISPTRADFPRRDLGGRVPFQGLGRLSEEPDAEQKALFGSQNTATDSFGRSTQDSFGSNVQGSRVTPTQPRSAGEDGAQKDIQD